MTYTIPSAEGVRYAVNGVRQPAGEYQGESAVNVVASPSPGYTLTGPTTWNHDFSFAFTDVNSETKFAEEIMWAAGAGITTGWPDGTYRPLVPINRDAMAAFLYRLAGEPEYEAPATSPFEDYPRGSKFYTEVTWLADTGITTGWPDGTYRPLEPINRDAMAAFLYRLAGEPEYAAPATSPFEDYPRGSKFYTEVTWLAETGITTGWPDGTYRPLEPINRDAMAAFLHRLAGEP
ncbi:S-layer homology domain-containing protein, partial [Arthrobacter sp. H14]|uniref:S-layer homology domain-containing protein n=1 Tax=Arthrobacter sp. H14 TaxID=1312959 RepID=UPI00047DF442